MRYIIVLAFAILISSTNSSHAYDDSIILYTLPQTIDTVTAKQIGGPRDTKAKVISCFKAGGDTVASMYSCSGVWVTPRILTLCFLDLGTGCPIIPNTLDARQVVAAAFGGASNLDQKLSIDLANALALPNRTIISECGKSPGDDVVFATCVSKGMIPPAVAPLYSCASAATDREKALCLTKNSPDEVAQVIQCVSTQDISIAALQQCTKIQAWDKVDTLRSCVGRVTTGIADCLLSDLDPPMKSLGQCLSGPLDQSADAVVCLGKLDPSEATKMNEVACAAKAGTDRTAVVACFSQNIRGDEAKLAVCAAGDQAMFASCIAGTRADYKAAAEVIACAQGGRDASSLVANCSDLLIKDPKTRAILACVAKGEFDTQQLAGCAASSIFPPGIARYATCAATSQGPTSFALCAAEPVMNEEWRIAAECAVQTGGNPAAFAGCTAGGLTLKELRQCVSGHSCFGPDNTIVQAYKDAFYDELEGPGANNDFITARDKLIKLSGVRPNSAIDHPDQVFGGGDSVFRNPRQIAGGKNSVANQIRTKPFGGDQSVPNVVEKNGEYIVQGIGKIVSQVVPNPSDPLCPLCPLLPITPKTDLPLPTFPPVKFKW